MPRVKDATVCEGAAEPDATSKAAQYATPWQLLSAKNSPSPALVHPVRPLEKSASGTMLGPETQDGEGEGEVEDKEETEDEEEMEDEADKETDDEADEEAEGETKENNEEEIDDDDEVMEEEEEEEDADEGAEEEDAKEEDAEDEEETEMEEEADGEDDDAENDKETDELKDDDDEATIEEEVDEAEEIDDVELRPGRHREAAAGSTKTRAKAKRPEIGDSLIVAIGESGEWRQSRLFWLCVVEALHCSSSADGCRYNVE